jgi:hypothetical protein
MKPRLPWLCVLSLAPEVAFAQSMGSRLDVGNAAPVADTEESLAGPAKEAYRTAMSLVAARDFASALAKFNEAFDRSGDPRMLYDMAVCAKNLGRYARTQRLLKEYVREAGAGLGAQDRMMVDAALAALRPLVGTLRFEVSHDGAAVFVDGEQVGAAPLGAPVPVDVGKHSIAVSKAGFVRFESSVDVIGGRDIEITATLVPRPPRGRLRITADDRANIIIDGQQVSRAQFDGVLAAGPHELRVIEADTVPYRSTIDIHDDETRTIGITLERIRHGAIWPWVLGGALLAGGAAIGGYFALAAQGQSPAAPPGKLAVVRFQGWGP